MFGRRARAKLESWDEQGDGFVLEGSHDGYVHLPGRPRHHRRLEAQLGRIRVEDRVSGGQGQLASARILLHPEATTRPIDGGLEIGLGDLKFELATTSSLETEAAPWYPDFGVERTTQQIVVRYGPAPCRGSFELRRIC